MSGSSNPGENNWEAPAKKVEPEPINRSKSLDAYRQPRVTMYTKPLEQMALKLYQSDRKSAVGTDKLKRSTSYVRLNYSNPFASRIPEYIGELKDSEWSRKDPFYEFYNEYIPIYYSILINALDRNRKSLPYGEQKYSEQSIYMEMKGPWYDDMEGSSQQWEKYVFIPVPSKAEIDKLVSENLSNISEDQKIKNIIDAYFQKQKTKQLDEDNKFIKNMIINKIEAGATKSEVNSILISLPQQNQNSIRSSNGYKGIKNYVPINTQFSIQGGKRKTRKTRKHRKNRKSKTRKH